MIPLLRQIQCVQRELALRKAVYPRFIASGKMKEEKAAEEIAVMEAVLETLQQVSQCGIAFGALPDD